MKETPRSSLAVLASATIWLLIGALPPLEAAESDLPPKAAAVVTKFEAFKKSASPREIEAKRRQVIDYLGSLLKQEAAAANLEGALAVKALIDEMSGNVPPAVGIRQEPPATSQTARGDSVTATRLGTDPGGEATVFSIRDEASRRLAFEFEVPATLGTTAAQTIRCEVAGAADDNGDRGLYLALVEPGGKVAWRGFLQSDDTDVVVHETTRPGRWRLVIEDADTGLGGESPGNSGSVRVAVSAAAR